MKARTSLAILVSLLAVPAVAACAAGRPAQPPESREATPQSRDDAAARLVRALDTLKQPATQAEKDTDEARAVIEAIGGAPEMQRDAGPPDH